MSWPKFDLGDFPSQTKASWKDKVIADLRGKDYHVLQWSVDEDLVLEPMYTQDEQGTILALPARAIKSENNAWLIHQDFSQLGNRANEEVLEALKNGVNSISFDFDDLVSNANLLQGVYQNMLRINVNCSTKDVLDERFESTTKGLDFSHEWSGFCLDVFSDKSVGNDLIIKSIKELKSRGAFWLKLNLSIFAEAGFGPIDTLALATLKMEQLLSFCEEAGMNAEEVFEHLLVEVSAGRSYLSDLALVRSLRMLMQKLMRLCTNNSEANTPIFIQCNSALFNQSRIDPYNNLLRGTIAGMSAVLGGCDALLIQPHDALWSKSTEGLRYARNIHHLLGEEAYLSAVKDPMRGSFMVERLTAALLEKAWAQYILWSEKGEYWKLLQDGSIQKAADEACAMIQADLDSGKRTLVGVNKYQPKESELPQLEKAPKVGELKAFRWAEVHESKGLKG
jgi:methylmalonyl-CoA mutase